MAIQRLAGEEQNCIADAMLHGKPAQLFQYRAYMVNLLPFGYNPDCIILASVLSVDVELFYST